MIVIHSRIEARRKGIINSRLKRLTEFLFQVRIPSSSKIVFQRFFETGVGKRIAIQARIFRSWLNRIIETWIERLLKFRIGQWVVFSIGVDSCS